MLPRTGRNTPEVRGTVAVTGIRTRIMTVTTTPVPPEFRHRIVVVQSTILMTVTEALRQAECIMRISDHQCTTSTCHVGHRCTTTDLPTCIPDRLIIITWHDPTCLVRGHRSKSRTTARRTSSPTICTMFNPRRIR
uniref:(northern house mosquito) hypothetical protein n=1 Tax=Culex pipiens TaxID=7175 RepID=A0A8D8A9P3_CULPI